MSCSKQLYLVSFDNYMVNLQGFFCFLSHYFCILLLVFVNGSQVLHVNPGCLKCILGINLSPANKTC